MLKVVVISQVNDTKFWQDTFSNVWEGQFEISHQNTHQINKETDLVILDFSNDQTNAIDVLTDVSQNLVGKHFLIVSDKKDADLAIEAIRLTAMGFLVRPFKRFELISCLDRLNTAPAGHINSKRKARIITITSYKGGTGVSTTTANLGYTLSQIYQKKTLVIDAAGFSNHVTVLLNAIPKCTLADLCKQGKNLDEGYLSNAVSPIGKNLGIIGGLTKTSDFSDITTEGLEHLMEIAGEAYDYILVDTSTHLLDEISMFFIQKANDLLLLTTFDLLAIRDNRFYIQTLKELGVLEHRIKPIINRQDWYIGSIEPQLIQKQINHTIFHSLPNDWNLCVEATNYGRPVIEVSPNSQLATSFKILAGKITKTDIPEQSGSSNQQPDTLQAEDRKEKKKSILNWF
ncbi:MAG: hypothetical protein A3B68_08190 [Candidatus Melainabacteria bacterium RIFCSPHIGHO2_02_FULL_34_12]|nr:MAG: hypothetical protein A3B68_08190 [Candidatus Melainabacteria bacterium RIFCSPHIGHO2_02_FULL_34_12]